MVEIGGYNYWDSEFFVQSQNSIYTQKDDVQFYALGRHCVESLILSLKPNFIYIHTLLAQCKENGRGLRHSSSLLQYK